MINKNRLVAALGVCAGVALAGCISGSPASTTATPPTAAAPAEIVYAPQPTIAASPTELPAPSPTPTPTPTPTPSPDKLMDDARAAAFVGDHLGAFKAYSQVIQSSAGELNARARLAAAVAALDEGDGPAALLALGAPASGDGLILAGRAYAAAGQPISAALQYSAAAAAQPVLAGYTLQWAGQSWLAASQPAHAIAPLEQSVGLPGTPAQTRLRRENLAVALQTTGAYTSALGQYDTLIASAPNAGYAGRMRVEQAKVLYAMGRNAEARTRLRDVMATMPANVAAFSALSLLLDENQPVDDLQRGKIDYLTGAYGGAQPAFARAINAPGANVDEIAYWAGLNYIALENYPSALRNLDVVIARGAGTPRYADALMARGDALLDSGDASGAAAAYRAFARLLPGHAQAPLALLKAARALDRAPDFSAAAQAYADAMRAYPAADGMADAAVRRATLLYFQGRDQDVISATLQVAASYPGTDAARQAALWQAKSQARSGAGDTAQRTLDAIGPGSNYVSVRAQELLQARAPFVRGPGKPTPLAPGAVMTDVISVMRSTALAAGVPISGVAPVAAALDADPRWQRGAALWRLGLRSDATAEFGALYAYADVDPLKLAWLAARLRDVGAYRISIGSAADAARLVTRNGDMSAAPRELLELAYPRYYPGLIEANARDFGLDPQLLYALIRQESLFEAWAESSAAARGLMQVIPPTGREIAQRLGWPANYSDRDLNRPYVSARFGASYLARMRDLCDGDWYAALAAYNAGIGRALRWKEGAGGDPDLFLALATLDEPRRYIRGISVQFAMYRLLYG